MSASYAAIAAVGLMVPASKLRRKVNTGPKHDGCAFVTPDNCKFCPMCGQPVNREREEWIEGVTEDVDDPEFLGYMMLQRHDDDDEVVIALRHARSGYRHELGFEGEPPHAHLIIEFEEKMTKARLWDAKKFGLWAILQVD